MKIILIIILLFTTLFLYSSELKGELKEKLKSEVIKSSDNVAEKPVESNRNVPAQDSSGEKKIILPLIYISNFQGRFINISSTQKGEYYQLLGKIKYYQNILPILNNWAKPLTLNNGSSFWPSISIKYLLKEEKGVELVYNLLAENHFDVINIGKKDFYTPYNIMEKLSKDKGILKLPFLSSNMDCQENNKAPICRLVKKRKYKIIKTSGVKIGIISIISKEVINKAFYKSVDGVNILSEAKEANRLALYLKEKRNVDIVILLAQVDSRETSPKKTMLLSHELKNIDLIISNSENTRLIRKYDNDIYIVGANPNKYTPNLLLLNIKKDKSVSHDKYFLDKIEVYEDKKSNTSTVPVIFKNILNNYKKNYLKKYDVAINKMKIKDLSFKAFYKFMLKLMIKTTNSEIALINKKNFDDYLFPLNKLTYDAVEKTITYNSRIASFSMKGKLLKDFLKTNKDKLLFANIAFGKDIKINGRVIIEKKVYKIATTEFIANGGDSFFKDKFFIKKKQYYSKIKDTLITYLKQEKFKNSNTSFNPSLEFEDLSKRFLWEFYSSLGLYYMKNDVSNKDAYDKARFDSTPNELLKIDGILSLSASSNYHIIENRFELHYYQSKEDNTEFKESDDIISYLFNYKNNYFKLVNGDSPLIPLPFMEGKLNSELTKPEEYDERYFELLISGGASFLSLKDKLELKLGVQALRDFRNNDKFEIGLVMGYKLENYELKTFDIPININSKFEYFRAFEAFDTIDFSLVVNIPILGYFHFSTKLDNYFHKEEARDWAYYYNIFVGVNIIYNNWF